MGIRILDVSTINKIAAGEVIESPASVVKELVENSIDAGADNISVEIMEGGMKLIKVTDNGSGIPKEDIRNAFKKHATSKIKTVEDINGVMSLGFRGEALSSIASVSKIDLITKMKGTLNGYSYKIEGGVEKEIAEVGIPEGTTFVIKDLFYNTPVRKKFLRNLSVEAAAVTQLMERFALSNPGISFRYILNGKEKLFTSGSGNLKDVIYKIYGRNIADNLIKISAKNENVRIEGYIGKPVVCRGNRMYENYAVNGRYIKNEALSLAIEDAYKGYIMLHNYPFTALLFSIDPDLLDVNVHPAKREFRLSMAEDVCGFVCEELKKAIKESDLIPEVSLYADRSATSKSAYRSSPVDPGLFTGCDASVDFCASADRDAPVGFCAPADCDASVDSGLSAGCDGPADFGAPGSMEIAETAREPGIRQTAEINRFHDSVSQYGSQSGAASKEEPKTSWKNDFSQASFPVSEQENHYRVIGQLFATYWLIESDNTFYMLDQHAAHEKLLYEKLLKTFREKDPQMQMLSVPMLISVSPQTTALLESEDSVLELINKLGFEIELFGDCVKVTGMPAMLPETDYRILLTDILDMTGKMKFNKTNDIESADLIIEKIASMSCKAAIKGNDRISSMEAVKLISDLMKAENPYNCPHGRPTMIKMTKYEIEKKFGRII